MSHFKDRLTSPRNVIAVAYIYILVASLVLNGLGIYRNSDFFRWGPPITFFNKELTTNKQFYLLHFLIFVHQLINNWVNNVVYAWIINNVQDAKNIRMEYGVKTSLLIINLFNVYSELDLALIIMGFMSQISFIVTICIANVITSTYINYQYLERKKLIEVGNYGAIL